MEFISAIYYMKYPEQQSNLAKHLVAVVIKPVPIFTTGIHPLPPFPNLVVAHRDCWMRA